MLLAARNETSFTTHVAPTHGPRNRNVSVSLEKLRALKREAGGATGPFPPAVAHETAAPLAGAIRGTPSHPASHSIDALRKILGLREKVVTPLRPRKSADREVPGEEIAPGLRLIEARLPMPAPDYELSLAFAKRHGESVDPRHLLSFDTETTGLAGGTGTRAFMIGAADWHHDPLHGDGLRVRQLLMTTMAAETAMLDTFTGWLQEKPTVLSSYNGRCYDSPLLKTRYRLARKDDPITPLDHVDLLFPTRRRLSRHWENCRLATIERELLRIVARG